MSTNDGGPAFPQHPDVGLERFDGKLCSFHGMTLRDYFAAHSPKQIPDDATSAAIWGESCGVAIPEGSSDLIAWSMFWTACEAVLRYRHADAMLKAREVKP